MASFKNLISNTSAQISSGGTITGDLVINGDLQVDGGGSLSFDEIIEGTQVIDVTNTEALLVRKDGDGGDVFIVDTTNQQVGVNLSDPAVSLHVVDTNNPADGTVRVGSGIAYSEFKSNASGTGKLIINNYASSGSSHGVLFQSNGSTNMTLTAGGSLGIGGTPTEVLDVTGNIRTSTQIKLDPTIASGSATTLAFMRSGTNKWRFIQPFDDSYLKLYNDGASATQMYFASNNNIGINTNAPKHYSGTSGTVLSIHNSSYRGILELSGASNSDGGVIGALTFANTENTSANGALAQLYTQVETSDSNAGDDSGGHLLFLTKPEAGTLTESMRIDSSGNVGIGVTPSSNLHISNSSGAGHLILETTSASHGVLLDLRGSADRDAEIIFREGASAKAIIFNDASNNSLSLSDGSGGLSPVLNIKSGSVGIGISNPSDYFANYDNLVVGATSGHTGITIVSGDDSYGTIAFADGTSGQAEFEGEIQYRHGSDNELSLGVGGSRRMIIDSSGNTTFAGNQVIYADGNIAIPATKALYFDGGTHTRIVESAGDVLDIYAGTNLALKLDTNSRISLSNNDASARNTIFGYQAMNVAGASASDNVAIGNEAMHDVGTSQFNVAVGSLALTKEVNGDRNTAIGYQSLYSQSNSGTEIPMNTAVGGFTGWTNVTGVFNTWLGGQAGFGSASGSNSNNVGIGYNAMLDVSTGSNNVAVGMQAGANITDNTDNVIVGYEAFFTANSGENENVIIGKHAGYYIDNAGADENVIIGKGAGQGGSGDLSGNIVIGANALDATGSNNLTGTIAIGHQALTNNVNGARNTVVGYQGMLDGTGAGDNVAIGYEVLKEGTTSELNVAVGTYALGSNSASALTGNGHVALGYKALYVAEGASANNTAVGANAMLDVTTGSDNVAMGINSLENLTSGSRNVALGYYTMAQSIDTNDNVAIGRYAMGAGDVASDGQVAIGSGSLSELTSGERNLAIGYQSLNQADVCDDSIAIGYQALAGTDAGTNSKNIAIGNYALDANLVNSVNNVAIGHNALTVATGGQSNVAIGGNGAGGAITTADRIVAIGDGALGGAVQSQGNTGVGYACLYNATGEKNTAFGYQTANTVTTGTENTVVGWDADASASGAVNQTVIGSETTGVADNSVTLGNASVTAVYMAQDSGATVHADKYMSTTMPAFLVQPNAQQNNIAVDTVTDIVFDVERFDQGSNFASNTFTAPVTGKYFLNVSLYGKQVDSASDYIQVYIVTSNRTYTMIIDPDFGQDASYWSFNNSVLADMDANDTAKIQVFQSTGSAQLDIGTASYFSGYLVC